MRPTFDASSSESKLNELVRLLKSQANTGAPQDVYVARIHETSIAIHAEIRQACGNGCEVVAHKDSGRELTMHTVGPIRRTRFSYGLGFERSIDTLDDDCELLTIERFQVHIYE